jgi:predicted nucleotidyltransferase
LYDLKPVLKAKYNVETMEIFGSYARRGQTQQSDIDLLVTYSEAPDIVGVNSLKRFLRRKLGVKVDIVSKKYVNPLIKEKILKEAIPI